MIRIRALLLCLVLASPLRAQSVSSPSTIEYKTFYSKALNQEKRCAVYLPPGYATSTARYPVLYFLHGLFESERRWEQHGINRMVDSLIAAGTIQSMIIAIPEANNSFYTNAVGGGADYENYLLHDFIPFIDATYRTQPTRSFRAISGISMGGYGALKLAMRHPDLFSAASAHSAMLLPAPLDQLSPQLRASYQSQFFEAVFGKPVDEAYWSQHDPVTLAGRTKGLDRVAWYFDCGTEDRFGFDQGATKLHQVLDRAGVSHEYHLFPGGHGWEYMKTTAHRSLRFHSMHFQQSR